MNIIFFISLDDALEANDLVTEVFRKYHQLIIKNRPRHANSCLISTQNSANGGGGATANDSQSSTNSSKNTMDELQEIFATTSNSNVSYSNGSTIMTTLTPMLASTKVKTNGNF